MANYPGYGPTPPNYNPAPNDQTFTPVNVKPGANVKYAGQSFDNVLNPFGLGVQDASYGGTTIHGGHRDLLKTIATRNIATSGLMDLLESRGRDSSFDAALQSFAENQGGKLGAEAYSNYNMRPSTEALILDDKRRAGLSDLLAQDYVLGGGIYGGALKAWASAKQIDKARRAAKTEAIQGLVGGILKGLGLYDMYGIGPTTTGNIGFLRGEG